MDKLSVQPILDGELLRAFSAFAETQNFTRAARRIGLSQPALHERVRRLGDQLGVTLYERRGRALELTAEGLRVAAFARDMLSRSRTFVGDLTGAAVSEQVTLAAGEGSYLYLLGPALRRFAREGEGAPVELRVLTLGGPSALSAVRSGAAHVAVGVFDLIPRGVVSRDIIKTPLCAALPRGHRLARRKTVRLRDLESERMILAPTGQKHRAVVGRAIASLGGSVAPPVEADGWPLMLGFVAAGLGVAVVNGICRGPAGVVLRRIPELGTVTYRAIRRRATADVPAAVRLIETIARTCGQPPKR